MKRVSGGVAKSVFVFFHRSPQLRSLRHYLTASPTTDRTLQLYLRLVVGSWR